LQFIDFDCELATTCRQKKQPLHKESRREAGFKVEVVCPVMPADPGKGRPESEGFIDIDQ